MENDQHTRFIDLVDPEINVELKRFPMMGLVFIKALWVSFFRSNPIDPDAGIQKARINLKSYVLDPKKILNYKQVCCFTNDLSGDRPDTLSDNRSGHIPISYFQSLFVSLLGKFITSEYFPINPLGLIHIFQSIELKRTICIDEPLDLSCTLSDMTQTPKGIESKFNLQINVKGELVWQGVSVFLSKNRAIEKKTKKKQDPVVLKKNQTIFVPSGTGRKYAAVSGDYNPLHLYSFLAKCFGFKRAIAHGMWSMARVIASLDKEFGLCHGPSYVETFFKRPVFMPATLTLGYEQKIQPKNEQMLVNFELRDDQNDMPHLKGYFLKPNQNQQS
ncbi:MAG: MaoC/PaaZ C-terminal domain-containing protein [Pseudomonadota bacterium]